MNSKKVLKILLIIIGLFIGIIGFIWLYSFAYDINDISEGAFIERYNSPNNNYTLNVYVISPALSADFLRVEIIDNSTESKRNIYFGHNEKKASISFVDNDNVIINGHKIKMKKGFYSWQNPFSFISNYI